MRLIKVIFFLFLAQFLFAQIVCNVCPSGSALTLQSTYPSTASHQWNCTNGFNSTLQNPTFNPTENCICYLQVTDTLCIAYDTITVNVCNCNNNYCLGMSYNAASNSLSFTKNGSGNSGILTDVIQYKREQQTTWTNVPISNTLSGCDVKSTLNITPYCDFFNGSFNIGYNRTVCSDAVVTQWQWRGNDGSAISGFPQSYQTTDWISLTTSQLANNGNGGVLDIFARVLNNPNRWVLSKIRFTYDGSGTSCTDITSSVINEGSYLFDFEARRITTYSNGCPPDTCYTNINLPDDQSCQVSGYIARVNFFGGDCPQVAGGGGLFLYTLNMKAPVTFQWRYNGVNTANSPASYTAGGYCLSGKPFGEYCCIATDADGCQVTDCYTYQNICTSNIVINESGGNLTTTITGCTGTPSYQWRRFQGGSWVNVGTGSSYNTGGVSGQYQVTLTCSGPPVCTSIAEREYINPCNVIPTISVGTTTLTANVSGCGGSNISYTWQRWTGSTWSTVQTLTTANTSNTHSPSVSGLYRILITCNGCSAQNQASITLPDPCQFFTVSMTGNFGTICAGQGNTFNRTVSGGSMPYSTTWYVNGSYVSNFSSFTYSPPAAGTYQIQVTVFDNNGCQFTDTRFINVQNCCALSTSISPNNTNVCTNTSQTFTRNASGGSGTVLTSWFSRLNGGTSVFEGSGSNITLNKSVSGTYEITATSTDASGCNSTATANMSVNSCTTCNCTPFISNTNPCGLNIAVGGTGCSGYSYQLQYSATGSGWTTIASGASFNPFNYTPTANGFYRIVINKPDCGGATDQTQVTCVSTACTNQPTVSLTATNTTQCGLTPIVISGTRGGSATSVSFAISGNALGSLSANSSSAANFSVTYTPNAADVNKTLTVTVTTNNPLGSPCVASSASHTINLLNNPSPSVTSSGGVLCVGQSRNLTATPTGGIWSVISGNGEIVGSTLTATGTGNIVVGYSLNVGGCSGSTTQTINAVAIPSAPTTTVNCSGGFGNAVITVTAPTGLEYRRNTGTWQSSLTFSGVGNGNQTIFVRNASGCENSAVVNVACGCANSPNVNIPANDQQCGIETKTITGSFSGASQVSLTLSSNAGGTLSTNLLTSSPFSFTYTPVAGDINKTIIITFTTNNPSGAPCVADIKNYSLAINPLPTAVITGPNAICNGLSATLTASGGSTYSWNSPLGLGAVKTVNPTTTTTYTVTVTSSQNCQSTATKIVTVNPLPTVSISNTATNLCIGQTRTFTGVPSGGTWSNTGVGSFVGNVYSSTTAGAATIIYTYTDGNGCTNTANQSFTVVALPTTPTLTTDCSLGFGNGRITVTNPTGLEYSLNASTWQTSTLFTGLANGNYTVYVQNATGCISSNTVTLNCGCVGGPTISVSPSSGTTCGTNAKSITGSIGGSATTVSGVLSANAGGSLSGSAFPFTYTPVLGDIGKTIIVTFTTNTSAGCVEAVGTYTLTVLAPPTASISGPSSFCAGSSIDLVASGGTGYSWSSGESIATKTVTSAGTYTVTVTSANGCTATATRTVTQNSLPSVSITAGPSSLCVGQSRSMAGTPVGGVWSLSGVGQLTGNQYTATTAGSATITYTYTDVNGCVNSTNTSITSVANPIVPTFSVNCSGGSGNGIITVTAPTGAGIEYRLNSGSWQSSTTFSSVANGSYTLSVRNSGGCENSTIVNVNCGCANEPTLSLSANSFTCATNPATITGTFGGSATEVFISENGGGSLSISSSTSSSFSFTYTPAIGDIGNIVTITVVTNNPLGAPCVAATRTYLLDVRTLPSAQITGNNSICIGQSTTLTASGGSSYSWSSGETTASITKSPTSNTTYTVTVTGSNTCTNTSTRTVTVNALPTPSISSSSTNICVGQTRTLVGSPSGGSWSIVSGTGATINGNVLSTSGIGAITVRYTYTNGNNCTNTVDQSLSIVAFPSVPTITQTCTANSTSTVTVTAPTGQEYKLNGGSWTSSTSFTGVADGNHIIYVRNASGCESQLSFSTSCGCLVQPTLTLAPNSTTCFTTPKTVTGNVFANATNVTATENGDGSLSTSTFGSSPFSFTYTPTANDVGNTVTITFTANIGSPCTPVTRTYLLQVLPLPTASITGNNVICSGQSTVFTASGGSTYSWSNGGNTASQTLSVAGTYTVTVTAANTCTSTATRTLTVNSLPSPSITSSSSNLCTGASRTLTATPSGGTFTVISGTASIIGNVLTTNIAGTVTVQYSYTDGNGCSNTTTQSITFIANPSQPTVNSTCTATNISTVTITPPGSGGPFTYSFNGSSFTSTTTYTNVPNGNHTIVIRNSNNCETARVFSTNCGCLTNPSITLSSTTGAVCGTQSITVTGNTFNAATQVTASHNGSGVLNQSLFTSSPFSFTYTPSQSDIGTNVTITFQTNNPDGAPCQASTAFYNLNVRAVPNITFSGNTSICVGQSTTLTASGALTYSWSNGLGSGASKTVSPTSTTTYTVTATASNTCTNIATVTVNVNPLPTINIITSGVVLCNNSTRLLEATPVGGTWTINEGPVGTYILNNQVIVPGNASGDVGLLYTVTNQFNCSNSAELVIPISVKPTDPVVSLSSCSNGLVNVTVTSPTTLGNEFSLDNGAWTTSNVFNNVAVGSHTIRVRNFDGCVSSSNFNVVCATCGCPGATLVFVDCDAEIEGVCAGYSVQFQRNDGGSWVNIASNGTFVKAENGKSYRVVLSQAGCPNITTNTITNNFNFTPTTQTINLTNSANHTDPVNAWGILGTKFFSSSTTLPITRTATGTIEKISGPENAWYCPTSAGCPFGRRMNISAVKSQQNAQYYEFTIPSGVSGVSIGFAADDDGELCVNGVTVFSLLSSNDIVIGQAQSVDNFNYWRIIDRTISAGDVIRVKYTDKFGFFNGAGVEIYSQPISVLSTINTNVPVVYSTRNVTAATYFICPGGTAPDGSILSCASNPNCKCN